MKMSYNANHTYEECYLKADSAYNKLIISGFIEQWESNQLKK